MIKKINLYISIFLFLTCCVSFVGFGYYDQMPDHFMKISDESIHFLLSFYFNSLISFLAFYIGPWAIAPSTILLVLYFKGIITNRFLSDYWFLPIFWIFSFFFFGVFIQSFLSLPLLEIFNNLNSYISSSILFFCSLFLLVVLDRNDKLISYIHSHLLAPSYSMCLGCLKKIYKNISNTFNACYETSSNSHVVVDEDLSPIHYRNKSKSLKKASFNESEGLIFKPKESEFPDDKPKNSSKDSKKLSSKKIFDIKSKNRRTKKSLFNDYFETVNLKPGKRPSMVANAPDNNYFQRIIDRIEEKLLEFKIEGKIINILKGPVVDTFELELGTGVKVSKVTSSAEDLSLALYGAPIRIVYPMKGRTTVGIEVPRNPREVIYLDELLNTKEFKNSTDRLPLAMGKDAFGLPFIVDLVGMPHMLVAGATGAGKSVFINTILVSLLVKKTPAEMKLILIDPKQLELALYSTLPHLIMPVVTDAKRASLSLLWAVDEMERRYSILKEVGVRNIDGYNEKLDNEPNCIAKIQHLFKEDENQFKLPYIVIIVDEFADLILTKAGKEIENNICRLAAKARAAGIHLIIATQRPSVDVITGLIKSNFPTRVSFRVTTSIDSRTILNSVGAERLLGKGDMLYKHGVDTIRVHSSFVDEVEIEKLTYSLSQFEIGFDDEVIEFLENGGEKDKDPYSFGSHLPALKEDTGDELFDQAVQIVTECRSASASMLQRRLKVGYNRAANLVELMEEKGIVGPAQGSKPRKVLVSPS